MKAVWYERTGAAPDVLTFGDVSTPMAGPGEVRVRLEASGVNPPMSAAAPAAIARWNFPCDTQQRWRRNYRFSSVTASRGSAWASGLALNGQRNGAPSVPRRIHNAGEHLVTPLADNVSFAAGATLAFLHDSVELPVRRWTDRGPDGAGHRRRGAVATMRAAGKMGRRAQ